jgi:hypothetical protein
MLAPSSGHSSGRGLKAFGGQPVQCDVGDVLPAVVDGQGVPGRTVKCAIDGRMTANDFAANVANSTAWGGPLAAPITTVITDLQFSPACTARANAQRGQRRTADLIPDWLTVPTAQTLHRGTANRRVSNARPTRRLTCLASRSVDCAENGFNTGLFVWKRLKPLRGNRQTLISSSANQILIILADRFFSSLWRILEPYGRPRFRGRSMLVWRDLNG